MMEGLDCWNLGLVNSCILCIFLVIRSATAQEGFVSIRCCADSIYNEPSTHISWITDKDWYPSKENCRDIINGGSDLNDTEEYNKARFFGSSVGSQWCYNLTTSKDSDYLIRGTFLSGDLQRSLPGSSFDVWVGLKPIGRVISSENATVEGIFQANDEDVNFCLLTEKGEPYISKLELRPLTSVYLNGKPSILLKLIHRVDVGNRGGEIRYPDDPYDRIWKPESNSPQNANWASSTTLTVTASGHEITPPPTQVLQTALTHSERLEFLHSDLDAKYQKYRLFLYLAELNVSVQAGQRVFDIYVNSEKRREIDIRADGSDYYAVALNFTANGFLNLTLIKTENGSLLGPICSAYEILQVHAWETFQGDVDAIMDARNQLLESNQDSILSRNWSEDPCFPLPWVGLACEPFNGSTVITKLNLASSNLQGPLPLSITKLTHLKELNMSNNIFTGAIPEFPASSMLTSLDVSHNDLSGRIPESLTLLPYLKKLYFGCNPNFNKELPTGLNRSTLTTDNGMCKSQESSYSVRGIVIGTVAGGSVIATIAAGLFFACFYRKRLRSEAILETKISSLIKNVIYSIPSMDDIVLKSIPVQNFTLQFIEAATQKYRTLIGEGGFGSVYRGTLPDGQEVAVKVRSATSTQGTREFNNELNLLSAIQHENLVPLLGYCSENDQQILVYPFMSNGSLQDRLYGEAAKRKTLDWPTRLSIALGAARGLMYLHTYSVRSVIHRDVKSSNILLDHSMCAKVADFGFSKYAPQEGDSGASLEVRGTAGYLDPEYYSTQNLSAKSDVFSFGVVLLEIISGREPLNIHRPRNEWSLVEWAKPYVRNSRIEEIVDPSIKGGYHAEAMWRVVEVALSCTEPFSAYRPCMADIVRELEDALIIENNASEYMKSIDSFGGSNRYSIDRPIVIPPSTSTPSEPSPILQQPDPPRPR